MTDFSGIKAGDRVRLVYEVTVDEVHPRGLHSLYSEKNANVYYAEEDELVSVEKIAPPLPTEDGWYESEKFPLSLGYEPYRLCKGKWSNGGVLLSRPENDGPFHRLGRVD